MNTENVKTDYMNGETGHINSETECIKDVQRLIDHLCPEGVEWKRLDEVCYVKNGFTPSKRNKSFWDKNKADIPWFRLEDIRTNGRVLSDSMQHVTPKALESKKIFPANSVIMSTTATIGEHALITVESIANQRFSYISRKPEYEEKLTPKFMFYWAYKLSDWCKENCDISTFKAVKVPDLKQVLIPLPPLEVQEKIVEYLDAFTELEAELEAELVAREKQYEWYRMHALDFKRKVTKTEPVLDEDGNQMMERVGGKQKIKKVKVFAEEQVIEDGKAKIIRIPVLDENGKQVVREEPVLKDGEPVIMGGKMVPAEKTVPTGETLDYQYADEYSPREAIESIRDMVEKLCPEGVEFKRLGDIGEFIRGNGLTKKDLTDEGYPVIHYGQIYTKYGFSASQTISYSSKNVFDKLRKAKPKDIVMTSDSETTDDLCSAVVWEGNKEIGISGHSIAFRAPDVNPRYIGYLLKSHRFLIFKRHNATGEKVRNITSKSLASFQAPIPPLEVQEKIVELLDSFDSLINDAREGIPAEIKDRCKQYEYYREQLLAFDNVNEPKDSYKQDS